jgi:ABC-type branched-subunit amino acid transport system permease subunit
MSASVTTQPQPGRLGSLRDFAAAHRSATVFASMAVISVALYFASFVPPLSWVQGSNAWLGAWTNAGVFVLLAMGLNIVVGFAGLLDLGYAAFFAFGAYFYAYGASSFLGFHGPFLLLLVGGAIVAAVFGIALGAPTLRLRGDYLAIVTLGFGEIVPIVFLNLDRYTEGANGISGIDRPALPGLTFGAVQNLPYYFLMIVVITVAMTLIYRLLDSRIGRAWAAIREDELAAAASGINTVTTKLLAFALGATTAGFAGVLNASKLTIVSPEQFQFTVSFAVLVAVVLGGMGNIWGVAAGAFVIYNIQQVLLKQLTGLFDRLPIQIPILGDIDFVTYQFLLFGGVLVAFMLFRPEGLFPSQRRRQELHAAEEEEGDLDDEEPAASEQAPRPADLTGGPG